MSSNDGILVKKVNKNEFEIRYIPCIENMSNETYMTLLCTKSNLEDAMKEANILNNNEWQTEYGISYIDATIQEEESNYITKEELQKTINDFNRHDETCNGLRCAHCGSSDYLSVRANMQYHNHEPLKNCIEEIYECECGQYTQVIWKLDSVHKLGRIVI